MKNFLNNLLADLLLGTQVLIVSAILGLFALYPLYTIYLVINAPSLTQKFTGILCIVLYALFLGTLFSHLKHKGALKVHFNKQSD